MAYRLSVTLFVTFLLSSIITAVLTALLIHLRPADANNLHCDMSAMGYIISWLGVFALTIGTTPVYFNLIQKVRQSNLLSLLSFFLVPVAIAIAMFGEFKVLSLMVSVPYLMVLLVQFIQFIQFKKHPTL